MPRKRRRLVVLGPVVFGVEGVQVGVLHVLPGIPGGRRPGPLAAGIPLAASASRR